MRQLKVAMLGLLGVPATYGGVERVTEELGARLADHGYDVVVYCRNHYTPASCARQSYRGMRLVRLPSWNRKHTDTISHTFVSIMHGLVTGVDIFHFHSIGPGFLAWIPRLFRRKVVVQVHNQEWKGGKWGPVARQFFRVAEHVTARSAHEVLVISRTLEQYYWSALHRRTRFIGQGITPPTDAASYAQTAGGAMPSILFVGRLVPEKGCHVLIEAVKDFPVPVEVYVAGGSKHTDAYVEELQQSAPPNVHLLGYVYGPALHQLYTKATVYVQPSTREGIPLTLLDAMAYGCCIVAGDIPELREVLGDSGLYAPPTDAAALRRQLLALLADAPLRVDLGRRAAARIQTHETWEDVAEAVGDVYSALAMPAGTPRARR